MIYSVLAIRKLIEWVDERAMECVQKIDPRKIKNCISKRLKSDLKKFIKKLLINEIKYRFFNKETGKKWKIKSNGKTKRMYGNEKPTIREQIGHKFNHFKKKYVNPTTFKDIAQRPPVPTL